jgi:hypothetical protein
MALLERTQELALPDGYLTLARAARVKGVDYHTLRMWLRMHPEVPLARVGDTVLVRLVDLVDYRPYKVDR